VFSLNPSNNHKFWFSRSNGFPTHRKHTAWAFPYPGNSVSFEFYLSCEFILCRK
jgi:hypothetical protein